MIQVKHICLQKYENIEVGRIVFFLYSNTTDKEPFGIALEENATVCIPYEKDISKNHFMALRTYKIKKLKEFLNKQ